MYAWMLGYTIVSLYAESTNDSRFVLSTFPARSWFGSISAVTLSRGPSLCSRRNEWFHGPSSEPKLMFPALTITTRKSSPGAGGSWWYMAVDLPGSKSAASACVV